MSSGDKIGTDRGEAIVDTGRCPTATCEFHVYVPESTYGRLRETGATFYCAAGHGQSFTARPKIDEQAKRLRAAEAAAARFTIEAAAAREAAERASRTCPWPTCEGRELASPQGLRQHLVRTHGAPWASPELTVEDIGQVLNGRDPAELASR